MNFQTMYNEKLTSAEDAVKVVNSGDWVDYGWCTGTPVALDAAMAKRLPELTDVNFRGGILMHVPEIFKIDSPAQHMTWNSWHMGGIERKAIAQNFSFYNPIRYSELPRYYRDSATPSLVAMFQVAPMDKHGYFNFGPNASHMAAVCERAEIIIVEVNENMPRCLGGFEEGIHISKVDMIVEGNNPAIDELGGGGAATEVDQAVARTLSEPEARYWFNCNPESAEHWFYKEWICNTRQKKALHLHFTMQDNPILSPEQIADAERLYTGVFYNRYIKGLWCVAEGLIYPQFDREKHIEQRNNPQGEWYISVDYGTLNAFSAGLWCYDGTTAYRAAEYYYSGRETRKQLTNAQYLQRIQQLAGSHKIAGVISAPSAASFIAELRNADFTVRKGKNAVVDGIRRVSSALQAEKLRFSPDCKNCIREFGLYRWDESCSEDRPIKENDHAMDDVRYFVNTIMGEEASISRVIGGI